MEKPERKDLIKISDYIWEIPKSVREDMRVPARIFAEEKMLDDILEDKSLWQLVNVASLPGIYKYALAMPDVHEGYGMCLTKDAKILTEHGYFVEIKDLDQFLSEIQILNFDKDKKILDKTKIIKFFKLKPYRKILRITTKAGFIIETTEDHPIFTSQGMKEARSLMIGDKVAVYGFEGVPYERPSSKVVVDEKKIEKTFYKIKVPKEKSSLEIIIKKLKERDLLPLTYDNPKFPYLIKIGAFIFGDGSMNFIGKRKDGILNFSGKKEDLLEIKKDLEKIGYTSSKIFKRKYVYKNGKISYIGNFYVNASSLLVLLAALGVPLGKKVNQKYNVPKWLFKAPLWQKRLFLAVLFGCELRRPHRRKERKFGFNAPVFTMNKRLDLIENGKKFLKDIAKLCQEFGVKTTNIQYRRLFIAKNGNKTTALELVFSSSLNSLLNLWSKIGYEYNQERKTLASLYTIYLKHKKRNLEKRKEILNLIPSFFDQNLSYAKIAERLKSSGFTKRLILDFCYRIKNGYSYKKPKIPQNFITLKEFIKQNSLGKSGLCFDEIEKIEEIEYNDLVYDLTTLSKAHNFIANNFLVSNCVGGVAAFDYDEGIISPGICGYDINCLHPETKVNLDFGTYLEIKDLKPGFKVHFFDKENKKINSAKILFVLKRKEKEIYKIETKLGNEILITEDHPIYTLDGMKEVKNLILGEKILIYPFKGVKYKKPKRKLILDEEKFIEFCTKNGFDNTGNKLKQILNYLKKRNLLPLYTDSFCLPYLLKFFGYALGDGAINNNFSYLSIWGKKEDLEEIKKDLEILGIHSLISHRKRKHRLINSYGKEYKFERLEYELRVSKSFALLLCALGYPFGRKTEKEFLLPTWLKDLRLWQKRLFLAGFLGAELSTPKTFKEHKFNFYSLTLNINKNLKLLENGLKFMNEIRKLLKEFGVETTEIKIIKELGIKGKTIGLRFQIKSNIENLIRFFERVGFEYSKEKQELNNLALAYLKYKFKIIQQREEIRKKAKVLYKLGSPLKELEKIFVGPFINTRFLERSIWEDTFNVRTAFNFYNFEEFIKNFNYKNGFLIDEIEKIEKLNYGGYVYDLTIDHEDHNFIANNFVVSNCGVRLAVTDLDYEEVKDKIPKLTEEIFKQVPSGVGRGGFWKLNNDEMKKVLENGAQYIVELGYGEKEDLSATESFGKLEGADAEKVSKTAKDRGRDQLGTMGAGNHFVEVQRIEEIFDDADYADFTQTMQTSAKSASYSAKSAIAKKLGLEKGKIAILIHCGSRGLGHQVATDYIRQALNYIDKQKIELPDRELAYFPYHHPEGQNYLSAMKAAANFAFANRQLILHQVRKAFKKVFGKEIKLKQVYDVAHNIVKIEYYADYADFTQTKQNELYADQADFTQNMQNEFLYGDITFKIRKAIYEVRKKLGLGHKENVYKNSLIIEFKKLGLDFEVDKKIEVKYENETVGVYKPDFIVENKIIMEIKSIPQLTKEQEKQLWYYLKSTGYKLGKLIVHRKGATRAFWKGHPELAPKYQEIGQPTLIPGSMGTSSYILIGHC
jgi:tRNA-splicing ligase RtcB (3'-phosphate/5'-hydroxy nucleic acid ligase)